MNPSRKKEFKQIIFHFLMQKKKNFTNSAHIFQQTLPAARFLQVLIMSGKMPCVSSSAYIEARLLQADARAMLPKQEHNATDCVYKKRGYDKSSKVLGIVVLLRSSLTTK